MFIVLTENFLKLINVAKMYAVFNHAKVEINNNKKSKDCSPAQLQFTFTLADVELVETVGGIPSRHRYLWEQFIFNCIHENKI